MAWRWRCDLHFNPGSGMAAWGKAQLDVRLTHAFHLRENTLNEERTIVTQIGDNLTADIFWPNDREALAIDTRTTFEAIIPWVAANNAALRRASFMDYHFCNHDKNPPEACADFTWRWER